MPRTTIRSEDVTDDAITADRLANSINTDIAANTAKVTNATHTGDVTGATALTIAVDAVDIPMLSATGTADATTFLRGDNSWAAAGGDNTPYFSAYIASTYSLATDTTTVLPFDTEYTDSDNAYNTSTYEFTVPAGEGGTYWLGAFMSVEGWAGNLRDASIKIEVNTVAKFQSLFDYQGNYINIASPSVSGNIILAAADVVRVRSWCYTTHGSNALDVFGSGYAVFGGYKLLG